LLASAPHAATMLNSRDSSSSAKRWSMLLSVATSDLGRYSSFAGYFCLT